jgi:hypothetical protein
MLAVLLLTAACSDRVKRPDSDPRLSPEYQNGRLTRLVFDRDANGTPDTWGYMDGARVIRVEIDENGDGMVDRWEHYGGEVPPGQGRAADGRGAVPAADVRGAAADGFDPSRQVINRVERATRRDGRITRRDFFTAGVLARVEEDTNGDGTTDKWETYVNGELSLMTLDTRHRGTPDRRLVYGSDGSLVRIEADPTGSGQFTPLTTP